MDPPLDPATGHAELATLFGVVQSHYPGHTFRRVTGVDQHHEFARYGWELVGSDGAVAFGGTDVVEFGADGRIVARHGLHRRTSRPRVTSNTLSP